MISYGISRPSSKSQSATLLMDINGILDEYDTSRVNLNTIDNDDLVKLYDRVSELHETHFYHMQQAKFQSMARSIPPEHLEANLSIQYFMRRVKYAQAGKPYFELPRNISDPWCLPISENQKLHLTVMGRVVWILEYKSSPEAARQLPSSYERYANRWCGDPISQRAVLVRLEGQDPRLQKNELKNRHAWMQNTGFDTGDVEWKSVLFHVGWLTEWERSCEGYLREALQLWGEDDLSEWVPGPSKLAVDHAKGDYSPECPICTHAYESEEGGHETAMVTTCNHVFGSACLRKWVVSGGSSCPICREPLGRRIDWIAEAFPASVRQTARDYAALFGEEGRELEETVDMYLKQLRKPQLYKFSEGADEAMFLELSQRYEKARALRDVLNRTAQP